MPSSSERTPCFSSLPAFVLDHAASRTSSPRTSAHEVRQLISTTPGPVRRETLITRWPRILGDTIAALSSSSAPTSALARTQAAEISLAISQILTEVKENASPAPIEPDGGSHLAAYNDQVGRYADSQTGWEQIPWLWAECYLYRRLRSFFARRSEWKTFDPYAGSKDGTFASSRTAVVRQFHSCSHESLGSIAALPSWFLFVRLGRC